MHNNLMMDRRLHVLRLLAHHGTVTATAAAMHYTPSAVSQQLRNLSADLGVLVVERDGRGVRVTPAGHMLLERADELSAQWERVHAELLATAREPAGSLRLAGFSTAAAALLPSVAARLCANRSGLTVRIIEAEPVECFDLLLASDVDIVVVVALFSIPPSSDRRFEQSPLIDDPLDLLLPRSHALASRAAVGMHEAMDDQWIVDRAGSPYHDLFLVACAAAGFRPDIAHQVAEWDTAAALVDAGLGVALIPRLARLPEGYDVVRVPLEGDPRPSRHVITGVRRGTSEQPVIAEALHLLRQTAGTVLTASAAPRNQSGARDKNLRISER